MDGWEHAQFLAVPKDMQLGSPIATLDSMPIYIQAQGVRGILLVDMTAQHQDYGQPG